MLHYLRVAVIASSVIVFILGMTGCTKTAKQPAVSKAQAPETQKDSPPPPELELYHAFSNWIDAFNSL
ncbi:MAG: hypothetical protein GXO82_08720, partial [Chlorobi bacterium]|nr:hypothetical protein [Chlorobiota bacterium]